MKRTQLLSLAAAVFALAFAACTKDASLGGGVITKDMATSYAKVNISMPSTGTRAMTDVYDDGTKEEAAVDVTKIWLVLYDDNGTVVGTGKPLADQSFELTADEDRDANNVSDTGTIIFKLELNEGAPTPTQVATYVNFDTAPVTFNLTTGNYESATNIGSAYQNNDGKYLMTSSGYFYDGSTYTTTANIAAKTLYSTSAGAENGELAAEIYVERLAAKATVTATNPDQSNQKYIVKTPEGTTLTPTFTTTNWGLTGKAKDMYLLKKPYAYLDWADKNANFRSYWAEGTYWGYKYAAAEGTNSFVDTDLNNKKALDYISYTDIMGDGESKEGLAIGADDYTLEHTYNYKDIKDEAFFSASVASTSAIVVGNYTFKNGDSAVEYDDFYLLYNGVENGKSVFTIYNEDELVTYLAQGGLYTEESGEYKEAEDELSIKKNADGKFEIDGLDADKTYYYKNGTNEEGEDVYVAYTVKATNARWYSKSEGYFFVPIEHHTAVKEVNGYYGVVRNHSYVLDITAISGLAAPMDDWSDENNEDEPIIPDPDDLDEAYIKAEINVLSWHVVNQDVEL